MTDPAAMEGMMGMMKGNMAMMIPQTLIMSWINAFFAGFVISEFLGAEMDLRRSRAQEPSLKGSEMLMLVGRLNSETPIPVDATLQVNASIRGSNSRFGCPMGF